MININKLYKDKKIDIYCPLCSPNKNITNIVLFSNDNYLKIYCTNCSNIYFIRLKKSKYKKIKIIMNSYNETLKYYSFFDMNEYIKTNQEIIIEDSENKENVYSIKVQLLEDNNHKPIKETFSYNINTIWCKLIDTVKIKYSYQKKELTKSFSEIVSGNKVYNIGEIITIKNKNFIVVGIYTIYKKYHKEKGFFTYAKDIKRIFINEK